MSDNKNHLRRRAEEKAAQSPINLGSLSYKECIQIQHELLVHQIQLEMQNEELRRTQEELKAERGRYFELYDLAPVGLFSLSEDGLIIEANLAIKVLLGVARGALNGQPFTRFILPVEQDLFCLYKNMLSDTREVRSLELSIKNNDGTTFLARLEGIYVCNTGFSPVYRLIMINLDNRKLVEDDLLESKEKYRQLYERMALAVKSASLGIWDWNIAEDVITWDDTMREIHGISKTSPVPLEFWLDYIYPGSLESALESINNNIENNGREVEFKIVRPDGEVRHIYSSEGFIRDSKNEIIHIVGVNRDITSRKMKDEALRSYARRLIEMEEDLRKKIAADLHDEIGRDLTVLGLNLTIISSTLANSATGKLLSRIEDSNRLIESISRTTRNIMSGLRPPTLDDYGLLPTLHWHAELYSARTGIEIFIEADKSMQRLQPEVELALFRISQEALMNTAKYANAKKVTIALGKEGGEVLFSIADDGKGSGSQSQSHQQGTGWGMTIMRERAELVGADFKFYSAPGIGSTVTVRVPLEDIRCKSEF